MDTPAHWENGRPPYITEWEASLKRERETAAEAKPMSDNLDRQISEQLGRAGDHLAEALGYTLATLSDTGLVTDRQLKAGRRSIALWHQVHRLAREAQN